MPILTYSLKSLMDEYHCSRIISLRRLQITYLMLHSTDKKMLSLVNYQIHESCWILNTMWLPWQCIVCRCERVHHNGHPYVHWYRDIQAAAQTRETG